MGGGHHRTQGHYCPLIICRRGIAHATPISCHGLRVHTRRLSLPSAARGAGYQQVAAPPFRLQDPGIALPHLFSYIFSALLGPVVGSVAGLISPCTACAAARRCARCLKTQRPCAMFCALNSSVSQFAVMNAAAAVLPDVIAGPTINAARLNELCRCPTSIAPPSPLRCTSSLRCSACVELAGAWGGTADIVYSGRCVCTLADVHPTTAEGSGRVACSVSSSGIRCVKQCLEAVLVAFEAAGDTRLICF